MKLRFLKFTAIFTLIFFLGTLLPNGVEAQRLSNLGPTLGDGSGARQAIQDSVLNRSLRDGTYIIPPHLTTLEQMDQLNERVVQILRQTNRKSLKPLLEETQEFLVDLWMSEPSDSELILIDRNGIITLYFQVYDDGWEPTATPYYHFENIQHPVDLLVAFARLTLQFGVESTPFESLQPISQESGLKIQEKILEMSARTGWEFVPRVGLDWDMSLKSENLSASFSDDDKGRSFELKIPGVISFHYDFTQDLDDNFDGKWKVHAWRKEDRYNERRGMGIHYVGSGDSILSHSRSEEQFYAFELSGERPPFFFVRLFFNALASVPTVDGKNYFVFYDESFGVLQKEFPVFSNIVKDEIIRERFLSESQYLEMMRQREEERKFKLRIVEQALLFLDAGIQFQKQRDRSWITFPIYISPVGDSFLGMHPDIPGNLTDFLAKVLLQQKEDSKFKDLGHIQHIQSSFSIVGDGTIDPKAFYGVELRIPLSSVDEGPDHAFAKWFKEMLRQNLMELREKLSLGNISESENIRRNFTEWTLEELDQFYEAFNRFKNMEKGKIRAFLDLALDFLWRVTSFMLRGLPTTQDFENGVFLRLESGKIIYFKLKIPERLSFRRWLFSANYVDSFRRGEKERKVRKITGQPFLTPKQVEDFFLDESITHYLTLERLETLLLKQKIEEGFAHQFVGRTREEIVEDLISHFEGSAALYSYYFPPGRPENKLNLKGVNDLFVDKEGENITLVIDFEEFDPTSIIEKSKAFSTYTIGPFKGDHFSLFPTDERKPTFHFVTRTHVEQNYETYKDMFKFEPLNGKDLALIQTLNVNGGSFHGVPLTPGGARIKQFFGNMSYPLLFLSFFVISFFIVLIHILNLIFGEGLFAWSLWDFALLTGVAFTVRISGKILLASFLNLLPPIEMSQNDDFVLPAGDLFRLILYQAVEKEPHIKLADDGMLLTAGNIGQKKEALDNALKKASVVIITSEESKEALKKRWADNDRVLVLTEVEYLEAKYGVKVKSEENLFSIQSLLIRLISDDLNGRVGLAKDLDPFTGLEIDREESITYQVLQFYESITHKQNQDQSSSNLNRFFFVSA